MSVFGVTASVGSLHSRFALTLATLQAYPPGQEDIIVDPVVHFEIIGRDPAALRGCYSALFGWTFDTHSPVAPSVSEAGEYGFLDAVPSGGDGIPGGVGGGSAFAPHTLVYVGVADVAASLARALELGGSPALAPETNPSGALVVAQFRDPEGNLIGLAGPPAG